MKKGRNRGPRARTDPPPGLFDTEAGLGRARREAWDEALAACNEGTPALAYELAAHYAREVPDDGWGWFLVGENVLELWRHEEALTACDRAGPHMPPRGRSMLLSLRGRVLQALGRPREAEDALRECLRVRLDDRRAALCLAKILARRNRVAEARRVLEEVAEAVDADMRGRLEFEMGLLCRRRGRYAEALRDVRLVLERTTGGDVATDRHRLAD